MSIETASRQFSKWGKAFVKQRIASEEINKFGKQYYTTHSQEFKEESQ